MSISFIRLESQEEPDVGEEALAAMRKRGGTWAAYQNMDMGHPDLGGVRCLKIGPDCTFHGPPDRMPDTQHGIGWRYLHVGWVDLETGMIIDCLPGTDYPVENQP